MRASGVSENVTLNGSASIFNNRAGGDGGGVCVCGANLGQLVLNDNSSIFGNTTTGHGGGVDLAATFASVSLGGTSAIHDNHPENCYPDASVTGCTG